MVVLCNANATIEYDRRRSGQGFLVHYSMWNMITIEQSNSPLNIDYQSSDNHVLYWAKILTERSARRGPHLQWSDSTCER